MAVFTNVDELGISNLFYDYNIFKCHENIPTTGFVAGEIDYLVKL